MFGLGKVHHSDLYDHILSDTKSGFISTEEAEKSLYVHDDLNKTIGEKKSTILIT